MITRRTFIKLSAGSVAASLAWPASVLGDSDSDGLKTLVVYHRHSKEGLSFFETVLDRGAEAYPISDVLDPAGKHRFLRRLAKEPALVVGLTNGHSAFELQMAAGDAFHFKVPKEQFVVEQDGDGLLVPWAVAPITEIRGGSAV